MAAEREREEVIRSVQRLYIAGNLLCLPQLAGRVYVLKKNGGWGGQLKINGSVCWRLALSEDDTGFICSVIFILLSKHCGITSYQS